MILGMLLAVWSAGTSVSEEIEGRTALTVLSKPVSRRSFILGKYTGIMLSVLVLFVILSSVLSRGAVVQANLRCPRNQQGDT